MGKKIRQKIKNTKKSFLHHYKEAEGDEPSGNLSDLLHCPKTSQQNLLGLAV